MTERSPEVTPLAKPAVPATYSALISGSGWYVIWGSTAPNPGMTQMIIAFGLGTTSNVIEPIVSSAGVPTAATSISTDYLLANPQENQAYTGLTGT